MKSSRSLVSSVMYNGGDVSTENQVYPSNFKWEFEEYKPYCCSLSQTQVAPQVFKDFRREVTFYNTMTSDKGMRTGEAMPSCRWYMPEGTDLVLSYRKEDLVAVLRL